MDELIEQTVPSNIRLKEPLKLKEGLTERKYFRKILELAGKNKVFNTYIGMGYYDTITPAVILRNVLENPAWYTSYTPYQAEISQGRLEALLNFQTMVCELTGMEIANASLLDESTAAAEAMSGNNIRVVSMPCTSVFDAQDEAYRESVLPSSVRARVAVEAGVTDFWLKYVGFDGKVIGIDRFGESAPAGELFKEFGFTVDNVVSAVESVL